MPSQPIAKKTILVEVPVTGAAANTSVPFPNVQELQGKKIIGIQAFAAADLVTSPQNRPVIAAADALNAVVTFYENSVADIQQIPYSDLMSSRNGGFIRMFDNKVLEVSTCRVLILAAGTFAITQSFIFQFIYKDL